MSSQEKINFLTTAYNIPRSRIFNSRDSSFLPALMAATQKRGVDVVLNSLSGDLLHASWQCLAEFGTFVEIGRRDFIGQGKLAMERFESNRSFVGVDLQHLTNRRPWAVGDLQARAIQYWREGYIKPVLAQTFSAGKITEAFRVMQKSQHIGKLVVTMPKDPLKELPTEAVYEKVKVTSEDRAYLFVGGLGGLGRPIATWLAESGVKEIVFLSRSAASMLDDDPFVQELASLGCRATRVSGDVCNYDDVVRAIQSASKPIGGVLQASMVLRVSLLCPGGEKQTWDRQAALSANNFQTHRIPSSSTCHGLTG